MATNDAAVVGGITRTLRRTVDGQGRLASFGLDGGYAAQTVSYREDGRIGSISNADIVVDYAYSDDGYDIGYTLSVAGGATFTRTLTRDPYRRELVLNIANSAGGNFAYAYDAISRPVTRNDDAFGYNARSEVTSATIGGISSVYGYDEIGNSTNWTANCLNQYRHCVYDADGNMTACGPWSYTYDSANRLATVSSNGVLLVTNNYDARSRRVRNVTSEATPTYIYDDMKLVEERVAYANGSSSTIHYYWGKDLSGTLQGAGGVGGLLYLTVDGAVYIPCYDNNGNITRYLDANGMTVAVYTYDTFGRTILKSGSLVDVFRYRFSTKYFDVETGLYYYGYRFYSPSLMRWFSRDPIGERDCLNLYVFCRNSIPIFVDYLGLTRVAITMGTELKDSGRGELEFLRVTVTTIEPPKSGWLLNFIQLKKPYGQGWSVDQQGGLGPYYYNLIELGQSTSLDNEGRKQVTFWDAPGGAMSGPTQFYLAIIEMHSRCTMNKNKTAITKCFDSVRLVASRSWSYSPFMADRYKYSNTDSGRAMLPTMQELINRSTWRTSMCPNTKVEVK